MTTVGRVYRFRAVHSLPGFPEPWCFPHQHDYTVEVVAEGGTDTDLLDEGWRYARPTHEDDLNADFNRTTTVENLAEAFLARMLDVVRVLSVTVWEDRARFGRAER